MYLVCLTFVYLANVLRTWSKWRRRYPPHTLLHYDGLPSFIKRTVPLLPLPNHSMSYFRSAIDAVGYRAIPVFV